MASSEHMSSSSFIKHKYVILLLKIRRSKMATPTNDASKLIYFAWYTNQKLPQIHLMYYKLNVFSCLSLGWVQQSMLHYFYAILNVSFQLKITKSNQCTLFKNPLLSLILGFGHFRTLYVMQQSNIPVFHKAIPAQICSAHNFIGSCTNYTPSQNITDMTRKDSKSIAFIKRIVTVLVWLHVVLNNSHLCDKVL